MRRKRLIAALVVALTLPLTPQASWAQDKAGKADAPKMVDDPYDPYLLPADNAYDQLTDAHRRCNIGLYTAARYRLIAAVAAMRHASKSAEKAGALSELDPGLLLRKASDSQEMMEWYDRQPMPCPTTAKKEYGFVPSGGGKADPPPWAVALAERQMATVPDGFDRYDTVGNDALEWGRFGHEQASSRTDEPPQDSMPMEMPGARQMDRRYPTGFGAGKVGVPSFPRMPGGFMGPWGR